MKIAFYYDSIDLGGQQTQTLNIMREMSNMGHEVVYLYSNGSELKEQFKSVGTAINLGINLTSKEYRRSPIKLIRLVASLRKNLKKNQIDFVIAGSALGAFLSGLAAKSLGVANFWYVGGQPSQVFPTFLRYFRRIKFDSLISGYFGWPACFHELREVGACPSKFIHIPNAVDTNLFKKTPRREALDLRETLGIPENALVIGWVGRIATNMQVWNTLDLFNRVAPHYKGEVYLLVVGGGPDIDLFTADSRLSKFSKNIIITDWIQYEEVVKHINVMDIVPLLEEDPQGGSIVREAMACGRVVISVDGKSGTQRNLMPAGTSILVRPDDYMNEAKEWIINSSSKSDLQSIGNKALTYCAAEMSFKGLANVFLEGLKTS